MLVIAGAPSRAVAAPCDPCPPDCAMMRQAATDHGKASDKGGQADSPCKPSLACQVSATMTAPTTGVVAVTLAAGAVDHRLGEPLATPSHPPDRSLRPPIQL